MINRVCLDLDGVMANWSKQCCAYMDIPYPAAHQWGERELDNMAGKGMWEKCRGYSFWFNIEPFPWAHQIRDMVRKHTKEWIYLTKASHDPDAYSGKFDWIQEHFGDADPRLWICNGIKAFACRGPGDLLIDDKPKNLDPWLAAGGQVFHWYEMTPDYDSSVVTKRLDALSAALKS